MNERFYSTPFSKTVAAIIGWFHRVRVEVYTDGSYKNGCGSWAFVVVHQGRILKEASGRAKKTNSLRMEIQAAIEALGALRALKERFRPVLFSDSRTVVDAMQFGKEVEVSRPNADLINRLLSVSNELRVEWHWIKAHAGHFYNERCDELCVAARSNH